MDRNKLISQLKWRYAVKKFDNSRKISSEDWQTLEESLILTPSSYGLQPWKFILIQNPAIRKELTPASWNQTQVEDCSHFVVLAAKTSMDDNYIANFISQTAKTRGIPAEALSGYQKMMEGDLLKGPRSSIIAQWSGNQTYIALGNLMTCAAILGIDTCPMEGIDPVKYDQILKLGNTGYTTRVACAVGYRSHEDKYAQAAKFRFSPDELIKRI